MVANFDALNANVAELATAVDAAVAAGIGSDPTLQAHIDAAAVAVKTARDKLAAATPPAPAVP